VAGVFTDGDLRRAIDRLGDVRTVPVTDVMSRHPRSIAAGRLAAEAAEVMETNRISQLLVLDEDGALAGALTMHDLMQAKVI
jgi:arabinose-5-phosphate isomerase